MFGALDDWGLAQDVYHDDTWPRFSRIGVLMPRPGARTVRRTVVDGWHERAIMTDQAIGDDPSTADHAVSTTLAVGPTRLA